MPAVLPASEEKPPLPLTAPGPPGPVQLHFASRVREIPAGTSFGSCGKMEAALASA